MDIPKLFDDFKGYIETMLKTYSSKVNSFPSIDVSSFENQSIQYNQDFIDLTSTETLLLLTAIAPHYQPGFFESIIADVFEQGGELPFFGGVKGKNHRGILPTGETALFIIGGMDWTIRKSASLLLLGESNLIQPGLIYLDNSLINEPLMSGQLLVDNEFAEFILFNKVTPPKLSSQFPAKLISTQLEWEDLIVNEKTNRELNLLQTWIDHHADFNEWDIKKNTGNGYKALFYGPSGTGKTLAATLLGKRSKKPVYKVDLSLIVSKYIGETEKNLGRLFDKAENKGWILFFDEADSIFGKRTEVRNSNDKFANQEASYLLQRIEDFNGLVVLASNLKSNIDAAFTRRFNTFVEFETPGNEERKLLWENNIPKKPKILNLDELSIDEIARKYSLTGANIVNIIEYLSLLYLEANKAKVKGKAKALLGEKMIINAIKREFKKEGKVF